MSVFDKEAVGKMNEPKTVLEKLPVLKDDPLFWGAEEFDRNLDAFNHEAYGKAIFDILIDNAPPLSIGLFGPWGIGKSTVISILFKLIKQSTQPRLKPIYFNAWKYSGDSFRRQLLIEVAKQVYEGHSDRDAKILRLEQLNYTDVFREEGAKNLLEQLKTIFGAKVRLREPGIARILLALVILAVGGVFGLADKSIYPFASGAFAALLLFFLKLKFEDIFVIQESPVYDPKLIFPEQFETEFRKLISPKGPVGSLKPVVVIDDIDRCEPSTIRDILISIKTFVGQENCFFIVPCDDRSIVQIFQDPNQRKGYEDELLRKYFNVAVRIAPLMATDLVDFANSVSRRTGVPGSVVQMAILANYRDARKMKHFLNTFAVKYAIAKARQKSGFMPVDIDKNLSSFAKAVLVEDLFPDLFGKMVEHPEIYDAIERAALGMNAVSILEKFGLRKWEENYPGLKSILEKTRTIKIDHIEVFLSLKTTNPEARIIRGWELKNSIAQGDQATINEILTQVTSEAAKSALRELLHDLLDKSTDTFLKNTITASLGCYANETLISPAEKPQLARDISYALLYRPGQKALQQPANQALQCAIDAGGNQIHELSEKYETEFRDMDLPQEMAEETINSLYRLATNRQLLSDTFNRKFESWLSIDAGLVLLTKIDLPKDLSIEESMPSIALLEQIAGAIADGGGAGIAASNDLRKQVLFKYWNSSLAPKLGERFASILSAAQADKSGYTLRIAFVVRSIIENNDCLEPTTSPSIWTEIQPLYNRITDEKSGYEIHTLVLVFALKGPVTAQREEARTFALQNWQTFSDSQLRTVLTYLRSHGAAGEALERALIEQELSMASAEIQSPSNRTTERIALCYENRRFTLDRSLELLFLSALESSDSAFTVWRLTVAEYCKKMESEFALEVADRCLDLVSGSYSQARRQELLELFATVLGMVSAEAKPRLLQNYLGLCKHSDSNLRNPSASILGNVRKAVDDQDFKLGLNSLVRDICRMAPTEVIAYRAVMDSLMENSALFGEYEWRDLADLSKQSIQQLDNALQDYGLLIIERMPRIPTEHDADLIHLLIGVSRGSNSALKDRADKVLRKAVDSGLGPVAQRSLQEYFSPPESVDPSSPQS